MTTDGWIKMHRKMLDWEWMDCPEMVCLWVNLLLRANHFDKEWHDITVKRGQIVTSISSLAAWAGQSAKKIRRNLERLKRASQVAIETTNKFTLITICNYDAYQDDGEVGGQAKGQADGQTKGKQRANKGQQLKNNKEIHSNYVNTSLECTKKDTHSVEFTNFCEWIERNAPSVAKFQQPFTEEQYADLREHYDPKAVADVLEAMDNTLGLEKKRKSAYKTCKSWLESRGLRETAPASKPSKVVRAMSELAKSGVDISQPTLLL